jgi:UDP-N-acetylglucosamine--N-acetylmuramyl-(pentapeptide) pyrophosphoryl-undecaprenol N-acetylglucosamine transferase
LQNNPTEEGNMSKTYKKVLFAAGGTGGHLFPAQALADQLKLENEEIEPFFAGAHLSQNAYFEKRFRYFDIVSMTPFSKSLFKTLKSVFVLLKGFVESYRLLSIEKPVLVVGFGSFHVFPLLCAAYLKKIPLVLFESNAIPGKVISLFSKRAHCTGVYFEQAKQHLKGKTIAVEIPLRKTSQDHPLTKDEARLQMQLDPHLPTLLVFGGSQGSKAINNAILSLLPLLKKENLPFQLIHLTGNQERVVEISSLCKELGVPCYVKKFEPRMSMAWCASDVVICRSGAMTLSELMHYQVPGILIPYPFAADQHQLKNALFLENVVGGARHIVESELNAQTLKRLLIPLLGEKSKQREEFVNAIVDFKLKQRKANFGHLIQGILKKL